LGGVPHSVRLFPNAVGLSFIMITFDDKVADAYVRQQVSERLQTVIFRGFSRRLRRSPRPSAKSTASACMATASTRANLRTLEDWVSAHLRMVPASPTS